MPIVGQHENQSTAPIVQELMFLKVLFTKHPKSPSSWEHRRWCLRQLFGMEDGILQKKVSFADADMQVELDLCTSMAEIYPKNYYAWMHRRWLLLHMTLKQLNDELSFTYAWLISHVSDHSASNHRDQVIHDIMDYLEVNGDNDKTCGTSTDPNAMGISTFVASRIDVITTHGGETTDDYPPLHHILSSAGHNNANHMVRIRQYQLIFIESVFIESGMLIVHRPGHETLWYHRRNILNMYRDLLLQVFHVHWYASFSPSSSSLSPFTKDLVPSSLGESMWDIDKIMSLGINEQAYHQQNGQSTKRNHNMQNLVSLINQFHDSPCPLDNNNSPSPSSSSSSSSPSSLSSSSPVSQLLLWIIQWCLDDVQFVAMCVDLKTAWGYPEQRLMALRYHCYLLFVMTKSHTQSPLPLSLQSSSSDRIPVTQIIPTTSTATATATTTTATATTTAATTTTATITSTPNSTILFDFKGTLTNSLHTAALKLSQEDSMDRLWHYLMQR